MLYLHIGLAGGADAAYIFEEKFGVQDLIKVTLTRNSGPDKGDTSQEFRDINQKFRTR